MKKLSLPNSKNSINSLLINTLAFLLFSFSGYAQQLQGAWKGKLSSGEDVVVSATDSYLSYTRYDEANKKFGETWGGTYTYGKKKLNIKTEFNSSDSAAVGKEISLPVKVKNGVMWWKGQRLTQIDKGDTPLSGNWRFSGRYDAEGKYTESRPTARKTVKLLTGTRFQWIAMNTDTGQFFGSGGGTYELRNGVYTETIEFFSRDNNRVGAKLSFNAVVETNRWEHKGNSSAGTPIHEVWKK